MDDTNRQADENNNLPLQKYIALAGGGSHVARKLGVTRKSVWTWTKNGLPHSEWSGTTRYAEKIAEMCRDKGHRVFTQTILGKGR